MDAVWLEIAHGPCSPGDIAPLDRIEELSQLTATIASTSAHVLLIAPVFLSLKLHCVKHSFTYHPPRVSAPS